jgi:hypothetical protein
LLLHPEYVSHRSNLSVEADRKVLPAIVPRVNSGLGILGLKKCPLPGDFNCPPTAASRGGAESAELIKAYHGKKIRNHGFSFAYSAYFDRLNTGLRGEFMKKQG